MPQNQKESKTEFYDITSYPWNTLEPKQSARFLSEEWPGKRAAQPEGSLVKIG